MGARILRRRKEKGLTQEALANQLGVSNQAVSKWEGDVCCPDLQLLPLLADTLELSLDELFGRESMAKTAQKAEADSQILSVAVELPWEDDDAIHAVLFQGHRLLQPKQGSLFRHDKYDEIRKTVELHFSGTAQDIYSDFSVVCTDSTISGSVRDVYKRQGQCPRKRQRHLRRHQRQRERRARALYQSRRRRAGELYFHQEGQELFLPSPIKP